MSNLRSTAMLALAACLAAPLAARALRGETTAPGAPPLVTKAAPRPPAQATPQSVAVIEADRQGHYHAEARIDGFSVPVLVDTGATFVALPEAEARRLGLFMRDEDFKYQTQTANGLARTALTVLHEVQLGGVRVPDVKAAIVQGQGLSTVLLGMSFLGRLSGMEVQNGALRLRQ